MEKIKGEFDLDEKGLFIDDVSDEVLEAAACSGPENSRAFTIAMCTGQSECPY